MTQQPMGCGERSATEVFLKYICCHCEETSLVSRRFQVLQLHGKVWGKKKRNVIILCC